MTATPNDTNAARFKRVRLVRTKIVVNEPCWPEVAAFINSEENFAIFRHFGMTHRQVLIKLQAEIQLLENQVSELDSKDHKGGPQTSWRLQMADIEEGRDPLYAGQRNLL